MKLDSITFSQSNYYSRIKQQAGAFTPSASDVLRAQNALSRAYTLGALGAFALPLAAAAYEHERDNPHDPHAETGRVLADRFIDMLEAAKACADEHKRDLSMVLGVETVAELLTLEPISDPYAVASQLCGQAADTLTGDADRHDSISLIQRFVLAMLPHVTNSAVDLEGARKRR